MATGNGSQVESAHAGSGSRSRLRSVVTVLAVTAVVATALVAPALGAVDGVAGASTPTTVTTTFGFDNDTLQNFTVPANVTSLTITALGGQGGWGGADSSGNPPAGGYQGEVSGTISVTPGDYLTIGVGAGADEPDDTACTGGRDETSPADPYDAAAGVSPLTQYDGGMGGAPGYNGCSGYGGAGGAATAVEVGTSSSSPTSVGTIVAGGGGGDGGSGQYALVRGQIGLANYVAPTTPTPITYGIPAGCTTNCTSTNTIESPSALPAQPTQGQPGIAVFTMCGGDTTGSNADQFFNTGAPNNEAGCDGGGGAGGGGGAAGGAAGNDQFGSGSSDEWYGQGGSPGENSTGGLSGLSTEYAYYSDTNTGRPTGTDTFADPGAAFDGSVVITYSTGVPSAPTAVTGTAGNTTATLQWTAPSAAGAQPISDYIVQYSSNGGSSWTTDDTGSTSTSTTVTGLTNGTGYIFEVEAVNSVGDGPVSLPSGTVTPSGPPGAPTLTSITPEDGALQLNFTAPASTAPITGYLYQLNGTGPWLASATTSSPLTISGLTDGTTYSVEIEATNSIGTGAASNSMNGTPAALPGAPTITSVTVGAGSASVAFTPGSNGGSPITGYRYSTNGGSTWTSTSTTSPLSITGLANGTTYSFELEAINGTGDGAPTSTSFTTPTTPSAPVISSITSQNQALQVTLTTPASGGSPITDYQWSTDGGSTWYSESSYGSPCQSSGATSVTCEIAALSTNGSTSLANGTTYPIEMRAVNAVGDGTASTSQSGTPYTTPGAPTITTGSSGMIPANQTLTVSFNAPASTGGTAVTAYQYSTDAGATWHARTDGQAATATTMTIAALSSDGVTPLTNGSTYSIEIRAVNAAGSGPGSAVASGIPVTVPAAPTVSSVTGGNGTLAVTFTPGSNGGSAITSYQYSLNGGAWTSTGSLSPSFTVAGLTNGTSYSVEVEAVNGDGSSNPSTPVSGTPATVPGQPAVTSTSRGNGTISVSFSVPSTGGSPILSYLYSTDAGTTWSATTASAGTIVITTLSTNGTSPVSNGTDYPVEIRAVNAVGDSLASLPVEVAPATVPGAPVVTLTPGDGTIGVAASIANNGGSPITEIDYSLNGGPFVTTGTISTSFTIPGLTNGTSYTVEVRADNAIGNGSPSVPASATPATVPGPPTNVAAASDSASADVTWTAPASKGGSAIIGYTATAYTSAAGTTRAGTACTTTTLACSVTGLTNGTTYYIGVVATNAQGSSIVSNPLQAVTPIARPAAPTLTGISSGDSYLSVSFTAGSPGGDPITSYQYSFDGGTTWSTASGTSSPLIISGLVDGTSYTVSLRAVSAAGPGAISTNTETGTPATYPNPVTSSTIVANAESGQTVVSWTDPGNGGSAITQAQATAFSSLTGGTQISTCTTTSNLTVGATASCTLTGLTNGTTYYVSIQSENAVGWSGRSSPRVAVTPSIDPGAVSAVTGTPGDGRVALSWTPGSTGGSSITNYTIWYSSGGAYTEFTTPTSTATSATVTGLTNGTAYTFEVYAVNSNGTSPASAPSSPVTPTGPGITSPALAGGEVGVAYRATPAVSGGTGPYTWSVTGGSLPAGLTLNTSTGVVTGTPTTAGASTFTLTATDAVGGTATQSESVTVRGIPTVTSATLAGGEVGVAYTATPTASGGTAPYTWSVTGGSLPAGLTLNASTGAVTGTPTANGTSAFTLVATDSVGGVATQSESVVVTPAPTVTSTALSGGEVGVAYAATPAVSGGTAPYTWSVTGGSLPAGLTLNTSTGAVTGTPTTHGTSAFTLSVTDSLGATATQSESVHIVSAPTVTSAVLPGGEVGVLYAATPTVIHGTAPYTWSVIGTLPAGLSVSASTGAVTGTPTSPGTSTFTLVVTDSLGASATQPESVDVAAVPTISSSVLPAGEVGVAYDILPSVADGTGPYAWSVTGGSLPAGLSLNTSTGEVTGSPTSAGTSTFTLVATDALGATATQAESVDVAAVPAVTSAGLPGGEVGVSYDTVPVVSDGTGPFTWSVTGTLPPGLSLDPSTGEVTGSPTSAGTSTFTLVVTDADGVVATQPESVTVLGVPTITSTGLPGGEVGVAYDTTPSASGGTAPYTWSVTGGSLPAGLSLDPTTGEVTGSPTSAGTSTFTLVAPDALGATATQPESVTVLGIPSITSTGLPGGEVGVSYDTTPSATGGTGPYTWSVTGTLPAGLSLDPTTGEVTGSPTSAGTSTFTLVATDALGATATQPESVDVAAVPTVSSAMLPAGEVGVPYDTVPVVSDGTGPYTWSVTGGSLPAGLSLDPTTGEVTGSPTSAGTSTFTLVVTDALGATATQPESVTVAAVPTITSTGLPGGEVGVSYEATPSATGGTGPFTWSVTGTLPAGLTLDPATGEVTGSPTSAVTSTFTLVATDALGATATQPESVTVLGVPTVSSPAFGAGEVGVAYDTTPSASGGTGPYTWSVTGSLPAGLTLDPTTGEVTGSPTSPGTSTFTLVATDALGASATQPESVDVAAVPTVSSAVLPAGEVGVSYDATPSATGGTGPYTWSVTGTLPAGLTLDPTTGEVTGSPTSSGTSTFTLVATDSLGATATQSESLVVAAAPSISTSALDAAETGQAYQETPAVTGGTGPYTWSVTSGSLPIGLVLDPSTGTITGTPTGSGTSTFTLTVTDAGGRSADRVESLTVSDVPAITSPALTGGEVGAAYDIVPVVSDGTGPYTWSVIGGSLPDGLTLDPSTGAVTGTPTTSGTVTFTLQVTDSVHNTATQVESLAIASAPTAVGGGMVTGTVGTTVGRQLATVGGTGPFDWSVAAGSLPAGVVLWPNGMVSGTPSEAGTFVATVKVTDSHGQVAWASVTVVVRPTGLNSRLIAVTPDAHGYWIAASDGDVSAFGTAASYGTLAGKALVAPIVGIASSPDGHGYWMAAADGGVFAFGDARFYGSKGGHPLNQPVVGMTTTPDGHGYWLVARDGGVFAFGDARFYGSKGGAHLNRPVVGMAATSDGHGYWLVASDGGVFTFGDARFYGSKGDKHLNQPVVGLAATPDGHGYWLAAADGGVFTFGDARFFGSEGGKRLNGPVDGIEATQAGDGYWLVASDGGVFTFGTAGFAGAHPKAPPRPSRW